MKIQAMIHSLQDYGEVEIVSHRDDNHVVAKYHGNLYTAVFNGFTGRYYVDDVYGLIKEKPPREHEPQR